MFRASQQKELIDRVKENNELCKMEHRASRMRRSELERERLENLAREREESEQLARDKKAASRARILLYHDKIKQDYQHSAQKLRHQRLARISRAGSQSDRQSVRI